MRKAVFLFTFLIILCLVKTTGKAQPHSVLASGNWYKVAITETNVYSISGSYLENNGISISNIDPEKIRVFGHPGGILPQSNSTFRYSDPEEIAVWVIDGGDGSFDPSDKILFWAEGPNNIDYDETTDLVSYENNFYSDTSYFFLNFNQAIGKRVEQATPVAGDYPIVDSHIIYFVHELDKVNILSSGREWYGEKFDGDLDQTFETNINNWVPGSQAKLTSSVMASSFNPSTFTVSINSTEVGSHSISNIPNSQYGIKGQNDFNVFPFLLPALSGDNLEINYKFEKQGGLGYLNYFLVQAEQDLSLSNSPLKILLAQKPNDISTIQISNAVNNIVVWDVENFNSVKEVGGAVNSSIWKANIETDTTSWLCAFNPEGEINSPAFVGSVDNQDLHGISSIDLLIVTPPEFKAEAEILKDYKIGRGIETEVVTTNHIYNEFSAGRQDVTAIRDLAKYLYENAGLKYLLLFGKGTFDYKNILEDNLSFVPIYESRNSLSPLYTYGSDDYLAFMEASEGEWNESISGDHTMDIGVGRLPIKSKEEAETIIEKIKRYESSSTTGQWKKQVLFVAENGDGNLHQNDAEKLSTLVDTTYYSFDPKKIYVDAYPIEIYPSKTEAPQVNEAIEEAINNGAFIINYTGHGDEGQWAKSDIFNTDMIEGLNNNPHFPLFITATCEFGRHDDTDIISGGEELVVKENNGAIGIITTCRPVFAPSNYALNLAFYNEVFSKVNGQYKALGDIFSATKNNSLNGPNNRNFSLLADPSLKLAYPEKLLQLDSLNNNPLQLTDTIGALEKVRFTGTVRNTNGNMNETFSGTAYIAVYDSPIMLKTLGNFEDSFEYKERNSALFKGSSEIKNGHFQFEFVVPLDINYQPQTGKISMYALANDSTDASGALVSVFMNGSSTNPQIDTTPPKIELYMEDSTFQGNDLVSSNSMLIATLSDENGINLSKSQVGHSITYTLDQQDPIVVNDYFEYFPDSYQSGRLLVPIQNIEPGHHILKLRAYDVYNNAAEEEISFKVTSKEKAVITELSAYPNPMTTQATFTFKHNLNGEELVVTLQVLNRIGELVYSKETQYLEAPSIIDDLKWDGRNVTGQKLVEGIYPFKVIVRSISSGAQSAHFGKLMIIN